MKMPQLLKECASSGRLAELKVLKNNGHISDEEYKRNCIQVIRNLELKGTSSDPLFQASNDAALQPLKGDVIEYKEIPTVIDLHTWECGDNGPPPSTKYEGSMPPALHRLHINQSEASLKQRALMTVLGAAGVQVNRSRQTGARVDFEGMEDGVPSGDHYERLLQELEREEKGPKLDPLSKIVSRVARGQETATVTQRVLLGVLSQERGPAYGELPCHSKMINENFFIVCIFILLVAFLTVGYYF